MIIRAGEILSGLEDEKNLQAKDAKGEEITFADILAPAHNPQEEEILHALAELDTNSLTPMEARLTLNKWQKLLQE